MPTYNQLKFEQRQLIQSIEEYAKNIKAACDSYVNDKKNLMVKSIFLDCLIT